MHYNAAPHREAKLVRCVTGAIWDAIVDLRPDSPTRLRWFGVELSAEAGNALYVPEGFAHGFITLAGPDRRLLPDGQDVRGRRRAGFPLERSADRDRLAGARRVVIADRDRTYPDLGPAPIRTPLR